MFFPNEIVVGQRSRRVDRHGSGQYGAGRGHRNHAGVDIAAYPGDTVYAPFSAEVVREAFPYKDDSRYRGVVLQGTGDWQGCELKLFYVVGVRSGAVNAGEQVGHAQDLTSKYPGITNHVHVELRRFGVLAPVTELYQMCF